MHFLLTNDDGIHAPGLAALEEAVRLIPHATWTVVAPAAEQSQCGHRVTTHQNLTLHKIDDRHFSVNGTPADCVRLALFALGLRPAFVLSGVNAGGNMGQDIVISGTVAAAREAAYHGLPAAAISHYLVSGLTVDWARTATWTRQIINHLSITPLQDAEFWNVNLPHLPGGPAPLPGMVAAQPCRAPLNVSYQEALTGQFLYNARYADRPAEPDSDVAVCFGGQISLSRIRL